jgi:hypothetical protein
MFAMDSTLVPRMGFSTTGKRAKWADLQLTKEPAKLQGLSSRNPDLRGMAVFSQSEKAD